MQRANPANSVPSNQHLGYYLILAVFSKLKTMISKFLENFKDLRYVKSHGSLFYSYDFSFVEDWIIFTVADWSSLIVRIQKWAMACYIWNRFYICYIYKIYSVCNKSYNKYFSFFPKFCNSLPMSFIFVRVNHHQPYCKDE